MSIADADRGLVADTDRRARRRAALRVAMRTGDTVATARAWDRLRGAGDAVPAEQSTAAWNARTVLGRAIRAARYRKLHPQPPAEVPTIRPVPLSPSRFGRNAVLAVGLLVMGALIFVAIPRGPSAGPPPPLRAEDPSQNAGTTELLSGGRGRLSGVIPPLAQPSPSAEPAASPQPAETPSASGDPSGSAGGQPGGTVGGLPGATGSPGPSVNMLPLEPPVLPGDHARVMFIVLDAGTQQPLPGVCVVYGTLDCEPDDPHTNQRGQWWIDLPRGQVASLYDFYFVHPGYRTGQWLQFLYAGQNRYESVRLTRLGT